MSRVYKDSRYPHEKLLINPVYGQKEEEQKPHVKTLAVAGVLNGTVLSPNPYSLIPSPFFRDPGAGY
jgi:hypothetical protein